MKILLTGGFFGSGKTTVLAKLTTLLLQQGSQVCIVENEIGENAIDNLLLQKGSIQVSTITGGCICCQVSGSLLEALIQMDREFAPDWVLVELTGAAFADAVVQNLQLYLPGDHQLAVMAITDAARWPVLVKAAMHMVQRQLKGAQVIVANKADAAADLVGMVHQLHLLIPEARVIPLSATKDTCGELLSVLEQEMMAL